MIADGNAQGGQFCLWPDGLDPRNCATPDRPGTQPKGLLMLREVGGYVGALRDAIQQRLAYASVAAAVISNEHMDVVAIGSRLGPVDEACDGVVAASRGCGLAVCATVSF